MYQLFYYPSNASMAPHMLLEEIGCPFELVRVDRENSAHKSPEYLKLNPTGLIPVLVDGDLALHQTAAICLHLTDRHPESGLSPAFGTEARSRYYQWLIYLTNTLQAELITYFYPERLADDAGMTARVQAHAERRVGDMLDLLESHLQHHGPFLLGDLFTAADLYLFMLCRWTRMHARPAHERPALRALVESVAARPAVIRTFAQEELPLPWY